MRTRVGIDHELAIGVQFPPENLSATCPVCGSPDAEWTTTGYMGLTTNTTITCPACDTDIERREAS